MKTKIHIALMVTEEGLPLRWELLPGNLSENTVLPSWIDYLAKQPDFEPCVLIFDRGMPSVDNFHKLVDESDGHLFLTSVKSGAIPGYVELDSDCLDALQRIDDEADIKEVDRACAQLGLELYARQTFARDLGKVRSLKPTHRRRPPPLKGYLYFNREVQKIKRQKRQERIERVHKRVRELNDDLSQAKQSRREKPTVRKVTRALDKQKVTHLFDVQLDGIEIQGKTRKIKSFRIHLQLKEDELRHSRRYDGITLLVGHPKLEWSLSQAISAYRNKTVVEADFRTIKSVLDLMPVLHWTDSKIAAHVTLCVMSLLVERLIELRLASSSLAQRDDWPKTANALLKRLGCVMLNRIQVGRSYLTKRTQAPDQVEEYLEQIGAKSLLGCHGTTVEVPMNTM